MTVLLGINRSLGRELASRKSRVGSGDWAQAEVRHGAVPAHVAEEFLDTHGAGEKVDGNAGKICY